MKKRYTFQVSRKVFEFTEVVVEAESEEDARNLLWAKIYGPTTTWESTGDGIPEIDEIIEEEL